MTVVRAPNRYQRPNPSYHAAVTAHTDSFKLPLQQVLPPGKELCMDVPPAPRRAVSLLTHIDSFKLPLQQVLPPGKQLCMDVPPAPRRVVSLLTHTDSFKLPLQQVLPTGQREQTLPPISQRRNLADWQEYILPWAQAPPAVNPFTQTDWPNPTLAKPPVVKDWSQSPSIALTFVQPPFFQTDWPNPRAPARLSTLSYHTDSFKLPLQQVLPPVQLDWPNPVRARPPVVADWIQSRNLNLVPLVPFSQTDWPLPPKAKIGLLQTWSDSFKLPLQQVLPPRQLDWPVPRGPISYILRGFALRNILTNGTNPLPYNNHDWPNPRGPQQPVITSRDFVVGLNPPVPPIFDPSHTLKNEIRRVRYLDNGTGRVRFLKNQVRS